MRDIVLGKQDVMGIFGILLGIFSCLSPTLGRSCRVVTQRSPYTSRSFPTYGRCRLGTILETPPPYFAFGRIDHLY